MMKIILEDTLGTIIDITKVVALQAQGVNDSSRIYVLFENNHKELTVIYRETATRDSDYKRIKKLFFLTEEVK